MRHRINLLLALLFVPILGGGYIFYGPTIGAALTWTQSNWSGGDGQLNWSDVTRYSSSSNLDISTPGSITLATGPTDWFDEDWQFRREITFNNADQGALTNFQALVVLNSSRIDYSQTQDAGQDIRFTDSDGTTLLDYEIELWNESGNSYAWVRIPQIDATSTTDSIFVYYGNNLATDAQDPTSVWGGSSYVAVYHMNQNTTEFSTNVVDSTGLNPGTAGGGDPGRIPSQSTGQVGFGLLFDEDRIYAGNNASTEVQSHTLSTWIRPTDLSDVALTHMIASKADDITEAGIEWGIRFGQLAFAYYDGSIQGWYAAGPTITTGSWLKVDFVWSVTNMILYVNGEQVASFPTSGGTIVYDADVLRIGEQQANHLWEGDMDEFRLKSAVTSADVIAAQYLSETDTFNAFGSEEELPTGDAGNLVSSIFDTTFESRWGSFNFAGTLSGSVDYGFKVRTGNQADLSDADDFSTCTEITVDGTDLSTNNCVDDGDRYVQYRIDLESLDGGVTNPIVNSVSVEYEQMDLAPPTISINPLTPDPTSDTTPTFTGTATDLLSTIQSVGFRIDSNVGVFTTCSAVDGTFDELSEDYTCTTPALSLGAHTIYTRATDLEGNTTAIGDYASDGFTVVDDTPPSISIIPLLPDPTHDTEPTFIGSTTDSQSQIQSVEFQIDSIAGAWTPCTAVDGAFNELSEDYTCTTGTLIYALHTIFVRSTDSFGNTQIPMNYASDVFEITPNDPSLLPPTIMSIHYIYSGDNAVYVKWFTDKLASSQVEYGSTISYGYITTETDLLPRVTEHQVYISNLSACTFYHFRVITEDSDGHKIFSGDNLLKTSGCVVTNPTPVPTPVPVPVAIPVSAPTAIDDSIGISDNIKTYRLQIIVVDEFDKPVPNAQVSLFSVERTALTNSSGEVVFEDVETGEHTIKVASSGSTGEQKIIVKGDSEQINLVIKLSPDTTMTYVVIFLAVTLVIVVGLFIRMLLKKRRPPKMERP